MLDEQFFMYGEDIDWSYRFRKAGWKRVYFSGECAFHHGGASSAVAPTRFYIEMRRANLQLCKKHYGTLWALGHIAVTCLHEMIRVISYCLLGIARSRNGRWQLQRPNEVSRALSVCSVRPLSLGPLSHEARHAGRSTIRIGNSRLQRRAVY